MNLDNTFEEKLVTRDGSQLMQDKERATMQPMNVFTEKKSRLFRGRRKIVIIPEGTVHPLKFKRVETKKPNEKGKVVYTMDDPNPFWNMRDTAEFVEKKTAESLAKHKPMTWSQTLLIVAGLAVVAVLQLYSMFGSPV